jgi:hypothetical protein
MLRDGRTYPDLPLRVVGLSSPNPGDTKLTVVALVETADTNRRRASGVVPIGQLAPGDYVLRAVVSLDGRPITTLIRILRKAAA